MTAPTINGVKYPQPVEELLPAARQLVDELGEVPSRNRLMREYRIGAPKADELRTRLIEEGACEVIRQDVEQETARMAGTDPSEVLKAALELADRRGYVPAVSELVQALGIDEGAANLLGELVRVARWRAGVPVDPPEECTNEPAPPMADEPFGPDPLFLLDVLEPDGADPVGPDPDLVDESDTDTRTPKPSKRRLKRCLQWLRRRVRKPKVIEAEGAADPVDDQPDTQVRIDASERQSVPVETVSPQVEDAGHPDTKITRRPAVWPVVVLALPAFIAVWSGWVGLGEMCGFGMVDLLPGFTSGNGGPLVELNTAITLPIGMETYGTYALYVWLSGRVPVRARRFAMWSAMVSLAVGSLGQVVYHLLTAAGQTVAPWQITTAVACLPVAVLGMGAALAHLVRE